MVQGNAPFSSVLLQSLICNMLFKTIKGDHVFLATQGHYKCFTLRVCFKKKKREQQFEQLDIYEKQKNVP